MMNKKILGVLFFFLIATQCFAEPRWYPVGALTGGGDTALDSVDGQNLFDGDIAIVITTTSTNFYLLDADLSGTESSPYIINPDANAGTKSWVLILGQDMMVTVVLTAAQVEALATPIEIVPAPGAGRILEFVSATLAVNYSGSGNWQEPTAPDELSFEYESGVVVSATVDATNFIDQTNDELRWVGSKAIQDTDLIGSINDAIELHNTGGDYTDSDAVTSTLVVNIAFRVHKTGL